MSQRLLHSFLAGLALVLLNAPAQAQNEANLNDLQEKALKAAVGKVANSVVQIETSGGTERIGVGAKGMPVRKGFGPTTGLVVSADGYVISSAFNFANKPTAIFVTVPGHNERYVAKVIANDHTRMLTLLKIEATGMPVPTAAPKKDMRIGQWALALGRTLGADDRTLNQLPSVSIGIISALNRIWGKAIQTDAKVSPVNYGGPLVNVQGQVLGVLVPASPRQDDETAGTDWYDSGIGFAIPLEDIFTVLPRLREGRDLRKGVLGITMQGSDQISTPAVIASVVPESAAQRHGLKAGDTIVAVNAEPVRNQAQLLHQLGTRYEGDTISLSVKRGNETLKIDNVKLAGTLASYPHSFMGILPMRDDSEPGEEVRFVYPESPADKAGLEPGDRITKIGAATGPMQAVASRDALTGMLNGVPPGIELKLEVVRKADKKTETVTVKLATLPDTVPEKLPELATLKKALDTPKAKGKAPAKADDKKEEKKDDKKKVETGLMKRSNDARDHDYWLYVPDNYDPNIAHALVLWLHPVGKSKEKDFEDFRDMWKELCEEQHMILLMPKAESEENGWVSSEADFVQQVLRDTIGQYTIDRQRVVAHGMGIGGQLAFYLGFTARDLVRAVATTGAVVASQVKDNVAAQRLQFYIVAGAKDPLAKDIQDSKARLAENKFSIVYREIPDAGHQYLDGNTLLELARWIDSLDRQ